MTDVGQIIKEYYDKKLDELTRRMRCRIQYDLSEPDDVDKEVWIQLPTLYPLAEEVPKGLALAQTTQLVEHFAVLGDTRLVVLVTKPEERRTLERFVIELESELVAMRKEDRCYHTVVWWKPPTGMAIPEVCYVGVDLIGIAELAGM